MFVDWSGVIGAAFVLIVLAITLWPAARAIARNRPVVALANAVIGLSAVVGVQAAVTRIWESSHPDQEWSMSAPTWLMILVSPLVTLPCFLIGSWVLNMAIGWNTRKLGMAAQRLESAP